MVFYYLCDDLNKVINNTGNTDNEQERNYESVWNCMQKQYT